MRPREVQEAKSGQIRGMADLGGQGNKRKNDSVDNGGAKRAKSSEGGATGAQSEGRLASLKALLAAKIGPLPPRKESSKKPKTNGIFKKKHQGAPFAKNNKMGHGKGDYRNGGGQKFKPKGHFNKPHGEKPRHHQSTRPGNAHQNTWQKSDKGGERRHVEAPKPSSNRPVTHKPTQSDTGTSKPKPSNPKSAENKSVDVKVNVKVQKAETSAAPETNTTAMVSETDAAGKTESVSVAAKVPKVSSNWIALSQQLKEEKKAKQQGKAKGAGGAHDTKKDGLPRGGQSSRPGYIIPQDAKNMHIDSPIAIDCEMVGVGKFFQLILSSPFVGACPLIYISEFLVDFCIWQNPCCLSIAKSC